MADVSLHLARLCEAVQSVASAATLRAVLFSGALLSSLIVIRSLQAILLEACAVDRRYPFVFQTLLLFPFFMQTCLTFSLVVCEAGVQRGVASLAKFARHTRPVAFFAALLAINVVLQGWSLLYISSSTYVVVLQLLVVLVALAERLLLQRRMSAAVWALLLLQAGAIMSYQMTVKYNQDHMLAEQHVPAGSKAHKSSFSDQVLGVSLCLVGMSCCAVGSIVQQRFYQDTADVRMSMAVKFFFQFLYGFLCIIIYTLCSPRAMASIASRGFFHGWSWTTLAVGCVMWSAYHVSTVICAYLSALALSMAIALVVIAVGAFNAVVRGVPTTSLQIVLMVVVSVNSVLFAHMRTKSAAGSADPVDDGLVEIELSDRSHLRHPTLEEESEGPRPPPESHHSLAVKVEAHGPRSALSVPLWVEEELDENCGTHSVRDVEQS